MQSLLFSKTKTPKLLFFGNCLSSTLTLSCITQILLGCKSKLDADIPTYSIFPETYDISCKDMSSSGGGVFSICRSSQQPSHCRGKTYDVKGPEVTAVSVQFQKTRKLYSTSYYHPLTQDRSSLDLLHNVITRGRDQVSGTRNDVLTSCKVVTLVVVSG